ncbi:MAG: M15 family metallopeptidase [Gemmatimonadaceae bacterium]
MQAFLEAMRITRRLIRRQRVLMATLIVAATLAGTEATNAQRSGVATPPKPAALPARWVGLIGEYGNENHVLISERNGSLYATVEWLASFPIHEESSDEFLWPHAGLYDGERLRFTRAANGRATKLAVGGVEFPRRQLGPDSGNQLRITPLHPVEELRQSALAAHPPAEPPSERVPDLVELAKLDPTIKLEIRYATTNNFLGSRMYTEARAFMQRPAANAVVRANKELRARGYGVLIHDAYRPWYVTKIFWDATPADKKWLVANPASGSKHNRGCAVDLTLYDLTTGKPVDMVSTYDESTQRAYADYPGGTSLERWYRSVLRSAMESQGFTANPQEWWHFDYKDWQDYPIMNIPFENIRPNS